MNCCFCCRQAKAVEVVRSGKFHARLCKECREGNHAIDRCLLCGDPAWHCARVAHFAERHHSTLLKLDHDPLSGAKPAPAMKYLGKAVLPDEA